MDATRDRIEDRWNSADKIAPHTWDVQLPVDPELTARVVCQHEGETTHWVAEARRGPSDQPVQQTSDAGPIEVIEALCRAL